MINLRCISSHTNCFGCLLILEALSAMSRIWGAVCRLHSGYSTSVTKKCVIMLAHLVFGYLTGSPLVTEENYALAMNLLYMIEKYCP